MNISEEAKQRLTDLLDTDSWFHESIEAVPPKTNGIGYKWYPIIVHTDLDHKEYSIVIHPCINTFRGADMQKTVEYSDNEVAKSITGNMLSMGHPAFYSGLNIYQVFVDPLEVTNAFKHLKTRGNFHGCMQAFDVAKLTIDGEMFYFNQSNCLNGKNTCKTNNYKIIYELKFVDGENNRIFNAVLDITINKRKNPSDPFEIIMRHNDMLWYKLLRGGIKIHRVDPDEPTMEFYENEQKQLLELVKKHGMV